MSDPEPKNSNAAGLVFDKHAQHYFEKYGQTQQYEHIIAQFAAHLPAPNAKILDLACGPGNLSAALLRYATNIRIHGIDLAPEMLKIARNLLPGHHFERSDVKNIHPQHGSYSGLICGFGIPYFSPEETTALFQSASKFLHNHSPFYLSTMEGELGAANWQGSSTGEGPELFIQYYPQEWLTAELENAGFRIIQIQKQPNSANAGTGKDLVILSQLIR